MEGILVKKFNVDSTKDIEVYLNELLEDIIINKIIYTPVKNGDEVLITILYEGKEKVDKSTDYHKALSIIYNNNKISINLLQIQMNIGFNKASIIISKLEDLNIISKRDKNGQRKILLPLEEAKEIIDDLE